MKQKILYLSAIHLARTCFACLVFLSFSQLQAQKLEVTTSYIGNTFNGSNGWVPNYANELDVASDGTMITASVCN